MPRNNVGSRRRELQMKEVSKKTEKSRGNDKDKKWKKVVGQLDKENTGNRELEKDRLLSVMEQ